MNSITYGVSCSACGHSKRTNLDKTKKSHEIYKWLYDNGYRSCPKCNCEDMLLTAYELETYYFQLAHIQNAVAELKIVERLDPLTKVRLTVDFL
jgi:hypothetical protein